MFRTSNRLSKLSVTAILLLLALLVSACGAGGNTQSGAPASGSEGQGSGAKLETVNFAYMPDMGGATPVAVGLEKGFFKEAGINLNAVKFLSGPPEFQAMASGDIDIAYIGPGATFLAAQGQGNILGIVSLGNADMVLATKKSGITDWAGLKGKTVGVPKGTSGEMVLNLGIEKAGLKPSDVNILNMDVAGAVSAFVAGKVDAVAIWNPYSAEIEKQVGKDNFVKLGDNSNFYPEYIFPSSWVVNPKFLKEKPDVVNKFMQAIAKTTDYKIKNVDEAIKLTSQYTQIPEENLRQEMTTLEWQTNEKVAQAFKDGTAVKWYDNLQQLFVKNGKMEKAVPSDTFLAKEPIIKAVEALGAK
ncbi:aliphatic sulfonate ABC transporter substrate-binding protein [Paenibacillus hemerocallicola]|uniref:Aliphatic sulfonate ABC transporter substrate-binding protein n=1 Tax=Paenibacillus hemerocallicola TaxID=1172614 RepID=A0A5C4T9K1_9BACL|nr:aliphatic sulfonate ABC transporter substrate-binding protein [Paenibacillus hemerocallicola]TNJ65565.1 aliphatic sulfonate ABC transporter substrate-binding protein [Paenibacillus hemerocallicola]